MCLMYITNKPRIAEIAEKNSVNRIFIDLETRGKAERQGNVDSVKSNHAVSDVSTVKQVLTRAQLLVRVNPLYEGTGGELDAVIERGADLVMLPMYKTLDEVKRFVDLVAGRARVMMLCETNEAAAIVTETAALDGVDEMFIGLNDLHLARKMQFMFELLADGTVDQLCTKMRAAGVPYGFGGIAQLNLGMLPAHYVIAEHYRLGSGIAILSRSFYDSNCNDDTTFVEHLFAYGIQEIRSYEKEIQKESGAFFQKNHQSVIRRVNQIVKHRMF